MSPNGAYKIEIDNNGIALNGGANGIVRVNGSGVSIFQGSTRLLMNGSSVFLVGPGGGQLALVNGGASLETPSAGSLDLGVATSAMVLRGPGTSVLQLRSNDVTLAGAGSIVSFGKNQLNESQIDLSSNWVQMAAGKIGLGGFCRGIVREDIDLVRNSYQFYAPLQSGGWENGIVPDASTVAYAC